MINDESKPNTSFLLAMIKHHEEALKMSREFLRVADDKRMKRVTDLAERIIAAQTAEISKMRSLISEARLNGDGK